MLWLLRALNALTLSVLTSSSDLSSPSFCWEGYHPCPSFHLYLHGGFKAGLLSDLAERDGGNSHSAADNKLL